MTRATGGGRDEDWVTAPQVRMVRWRVRLGGGSREEVAR
jgi:hypothetical protein